MEHTHDHSEHVIVPLRTYVLTFVALLFLSVLTVWVAQIDFGTYNEVVAMLIASAKAFLVMWVFMGLYWDKGFNRALMVVSVVCMSLFFLFTLADVHSRGDVEPLESGVFNIKSPVVIVPSSENQHH